jgi:hypothetical protein
MDGYTLCKKIKVDIFLNGIYSEEVDEYRQYYPEITGWI